MPRSRSSRGRHRGRRGRPPGVAPAGGVENEGQDPALAGPRAAQDQRPLADQPSGDQRQDAQARTGNSDQAMRQGTEATVQPFTETTAQQRPPQRGGPRPGNGAAGQGRPQGQGGGGRNPRRRQPRRQPLVEVTGELIKPRAIVAAVPTRIIKRTTDDLDGPDGPVLGCPMLSRTRLSLPVSGGHPAPRCSLGWGLHTEEEALYCMLTPDLTLCWKANPERLEILRSKLAEHDTAAD